MVKYVEGSFDEDYIQTLGVNFMEKTVRGDFWSESEGSNPER